MYRVATDTFNNEFVHSFGQEQLKYDDYFPGLICTTNMVQTINSDDTLRDFLQNKGLTLSVRLVTGYDEETSDEIYQEGTLSYIEDRYVITSPFEETTDFEDVVFIAPGIFHYDSDNSTGYYSIPVSDEYIPDNIERNTNKTNTINANSYIWQYPSAKAVYSAIHPAIATTQPTGGMLPNIMYNLGTLSENTTFTLAAPADNAIVNHYYWTFDTGGTAPTITWPAGIYWFGGRAPNINISSHYEISVLNNIAVFMEV